MIIKKGTTHPITRSDMPNENWMDSEDYLVVDDNSELGLKILNFRPYFDYVLDPEGNLMDITPTERPPAPPPEPTVMDILRLEQAQSNAEMIDLMMAMMGGM
jgi:hypothetical protein